MSKYLLTIRRMLPDVGKKSDKFIQPCICSKSFIRRQNFYLVEIESIRRRQFNCVTKMVQFMTKKIPVTSIFSFSHNVFNSLFPGGCQKSSLCDRGFKATTPESRDPESLDKILFTLSKKKKQKSASHMFFCHCSKTR